MSDIAIIGLPNSGKSTLLNKLAGTHVKAADYPFTTLTPNIGVKRDEKMRKFTICEIPGITEGASEGKGLGLLFLRHIERAKALIFLIDGTSENPERDYEILLKEIKKYNPRILKKKHILVLNKKDLDGFRNPFKNKVIEVSAKTGEGLNELDEKIKELLNE